MSAPAQTSATIDLDSIGSEDIVTFADGLVGLPEMKRFVLLTLDDEEAGAGLLQSLDNSQFSMLVTNPLHLFPEYDVQLSESDCELLDLGADTRPLILTTLSVHEQMITTNLVGPIVINPDTRAAKQIVLSEPTYSARHPVVSVETLAA